MREYVAALRKAPEPFGVCDLVLSGALRVLTHPRVFNPPAPVARAQAYITALRASPNVVIVAPGQRHWEIFTTLVKQTGVIGNLLSDAWYAALAIEHGCEWVSDDADFARFSGLRWRRPD